VTENAHRRPALRPRRAFFEDSFAVVETRPMPAGFDPPIDADNLPLPPVETEVVPWQMVRNWDHPDPCRFALSLPPGRGVEVTLPRSNRV
jgi:hypothetical protein